MVVGIKRAGREEAMIARFILKRYVVDDNKVSSRKLKYCISRVVRGLFLWAILLGFKIEVTKEGKEDLKTSAFQCWRFVRPLRGSRT